MQATLGEVGRGLISLFQSGDGVIFFFYFFSLEQYRQAYTGSNALTVQAAMKGFEDVIKKFPKCAEGYALYAQVCFSLS